MEKSDSENSPFFFFMDTFLSAASFGCGGTLIKTQTYVSESAKEERNDFAEEIIEKGHKYRLIHTEYQVIGKEYLDKKRKSDRQRKRTEKNSRRKRCEI